MPTQNAEYEVSPLPHVTAGTTHVPWTEVIDPVAPVTAYPDQFELCAPLPTRMIGDADAAATLDRGTPIRRMRRPIAKIGSRRVRFTVMRALHLSFAI